MGYGPSELFPVGGGTPVYTAGDQLWVRSHYNATVLVSVSPPPGNSSIVKRVDPGTPVRILTFNGPDPQSLWLLEGLHGGPPPIVFAVNDEEMSPADLTVTGYALSGGALQLNLSVSPVLQFYDGSACVLGGANTSVASLPVPSQIGSGSIDLTYGGGTLQAAGSGLGVENFTFSADLLYSYSFLAPNSSTTFVSRDVRVADSDAVAVTGNGPSVTLNLRSDGPLRAGRYQLRGFFEGAKGLAVASTDVLITGSGAWVWLGGCENTPVYSNTFQLTDPLAGPAVGWPRDVWLTYKVGGEAGFAGIPVGVNISSVSFLGEPWGVPLSSLNMTAERSAGVLAVDSSNGTIYLALSGHPAAVRYSVGLGNRTFFTGTVGPLAPFTSTIVPLNVSRLTVTYFVGGSPFAGGRVEVDEGGVNLTQALTGKDGGAVFYLPPGTYSVSASGGGASATQTVSLGEGEGLGVTLGETPGLGTTQLLIPVLGAAAVVGALANVALFTRRRKRRSRG